MSEFVFKEIEDKRSFDDFILKNNGTVFQTGMFSDIKEQWKKHFFMGFNDDIPVSVALCMERNIKGLGKIWYCPQGIISDNDAFSRFISFLKSEMNRYHVFGLCVDPLIIEKLDNNNVPADGLDLYLNNGFKRIKDKNEYLVQPPIDIITSFDDKSFDQLFDSFDKGVRHGYKTGVTYGLRSEVFDYRSPDIDKALDIFYDIITQTAERVEFIHRTKDYYRKMIFDLGDIIQLVLVYIDRKEIYDRFNELVEDLKNDDHTKKEIDQINRSVETYKKIIDELESYTGKEEKIYLAGGLTSYFGQHSDCLYGGTVNLLRNTLRTSHFLNVERIRTSIEKGCRFHSMGRVTGDPFDKNNKLYGLAQYKISYSGQVYEYVGDLHLSAGTGFKMFAFSTLFPTIRHIKSRLFRKLTNKRNNG